MKNIFIILTAVLLNLTVYAQSSEVINYFNEVQKNGQEPIAYVNKVLDKHDLIVFDDALHSAYEPFVFYNQLINAQSTGPKINYIFLEAISTTSQPLLDSFLASKTRDTTILMKLFQDDYSGSGWRFQTYLDLFSTVWEHNLHSPDSLHIRLIGVNPPVYWEGIHTWKDYELFQNSLKSRDYFMYLEILQNMKGFTKNKKALFLTNTRHSYKNIKNAEGKIYWNTTTFFNYWNPGKAFSIRIHNVTLSIESAKVTGSERKSTDGLNELVYKWVRMENGIWDSAFAMNANRPVAIPLENTLFGRAPYVGNHMPNVAAGTTMYDAYDALIFLAPLTDLHFSAELNYIYTTKFKPELKRRLKLLKTDFAGFLKNNSVSSFNEYYKKLSGYVPLSKNTFIN